METGFNHHMENNFDHCMENKINHYMENRINRLMDEKFDHVNKVYQIKIERPANGKKTSVSEYQKIIKARI
jgi:hypothetical protein